MLKPCSRAHSLDAGREPGITMAYSGIGSPLSSWRSFTQSYTGMVADKRTPGASTAPFLTTTPSTMTQPAPINASSSTTTGLAPIGSSTPPS